MFSVNIDKIVGMTDNEKKCYEELRENLKKELNGGKVLAITKNGIGAFKIAGKGEDVSALAFAKIIPEIFLGKYKLGKNLKGVADFLKKPSQMPARRLSWPAPRVPPRKCPVRRRIFRAGARRLSRRCPGSSARRYPRWS